MENKGKNKALIIIIIGVLVFVIGFVAFKLIGGKSLTDDKPKKIVPNTSTRDCKYDGEVSRGTVFIDGQYKYTYGEEQGAYDFWLGMVGYKGWNVILADRNSTEPVTTKLCTSINGIDVVSMDHMFAWTKTKSIDFSSFNTSKIKSMYGMFAYSEVENVDLTGFVTTELTNMADMFYDSKVTTVDLSSFDTSSMKSFNTRVFYKSKVKKIYVRSQEDLDRILPADSEHDDIETIIRK